MKLDRRSATRNSCLFFSLLLFLVQENVWLPIYIHETSETSSREITGFRLFEMFSTCSNQAIKEIIGMCGPSVSDTTFLFAFPFSTSLSVAKNYIKSSLVSHTIQFYHFHIACKLSRGLVIENACSKENILWWRSDSGSSFSSVATLSTSHQYGDCILARPTWKSSLKNACQSQWDHSIVEQAGKHQLPIGLKKTLL